MKILIIFSDPYCSAEIKGVVSALVATGNNDVSEIDAGGKARPKEPLNYNGGGDIKFTQTRTKLVSSEI